MKRRISISGGLITSVLILELLAGLLLIGVVANHERRIHLQSFDANLKATSNALLGAVQEGETIGRSVILDTRGIKVPRKAKYIVIDESGKVLGSVGNPPQVNLAPGGYTSQRVDGEVYRFFLLTGDRIIDPGVPREVDHHIKVIYGLPEGRIWHEVFETIRFFGIATFVLLGLTAFILSWLIRRFLQPIVELAAEAGQIDASNWSFRSPESAARFAELDQLSAAIERTVQRLQISFEQQRRFTSDAAHELKTDLAIVKSSFQLVIIKNRTRDEYVDGIVHGLQDVSRMEDTVRKMLTLARFEHSNLGYVSSSELRAVVEEATLQSRSFAHLKDAVVDFTEVEPGLAIPLPREDAVLLMSNILMNALQYSPPGSHVAVTSAADGEEVHVYIRDEGPGFAEADLPFLFRPFYRSDISRSRDTGGTGLGLSISKTICDSVGASILLTNASGGGAEVKISFPRAS